MAKFGFLLVLVLFGALMFSAGSLAPAEFRESTQSLIARAKTELASLAGSGQPKSVDAAKPPEASVATAASAPGEAAPIPAENLIIPVPAPAKAQYGLQLGQFADAEQAKELDMRAKGANLPTAVLDTVDRSGKRWTVVAVGPYAGSDDARAARTPVARELGFTEPMPLILLPASSKPKT